MAQLKVMRNLDWIDHPQARASDEPCNEPQPAFALVSLDLGGRIVGWNGGAKALSGYAAEDVLGRFGGALLCAEDRDGIIFIDGLTRALREGCSPVERWHRRCDGSRFWATGTTTLRLHGDSAVSGFLVSFKDASLPLPEDPSTSTIQDARYWVRSALTSVHAIALQTVRAVSCDQDVGTALERRIVALAGAYDARLEAASQVTLFDLLSRALWPRTDPATVRLEGPSVRIGGNAVQMLSLAIDELLANALVHGSLLTSCGSLAVSWALRPHQSGAPQLEIRWIERGGKPIGTPARSGFGRKLIEKALPYELGAETCLDFQPEGLCCSISLPLSEIGCAADR
ncbi:PAS domain S-box protein [Pseudoroseomonas globiformis]|uniref:histidine kinase n=1 Tax=Teichococcus globiformis TaxID=2307229 RepID=A0ABV7FSY4_9PROT